MSNTAILVAVIMATLAVITTTVSFMVIKTMKETHRLGLFEAYDEGFERGSMHYDAYSYQIQGAEEFAAWVSLNPEMVKTILDEDDDPQQALRKRAKRVIEQEGQY